MASDVFPLPNLSWQLSLAVEKEIINLNSIIVVIVLAMKTKTFSNSTLHNAMKLTGAVLSVLPMLLTYPAMADQSSTRLRQPRIDTASIGQAAGSSKVVSQTQVKPIQSALSSRNTVGLVKSLSGKTLELRLADGTCRKFTVEPNVLGSLNPRRGTLVALDANNNGLVTGLQLAEVDRTIHGTVTNVVDDQVTLRLPDNQTETTKVAPETAARLNLAPGVPLSVTSYRGTASTRICVGKAVPTPPVALPLTTPVVTPQPPVRALW